MIHNDQDEVAKLINRNHNGRNGREEQQMIILELEEMLKLVSRSTSRYQKLSTTFVALEAGVSRSGG